MPFSPTLLPNVFRCYQPGCIGDIASLHGRYYAKHWNFGVYFEQKVATGLAEFMRDFEQHFEVKNAAANPHQHSAIWLYVVEGRTLASLVIDGSHFPKAHFRYFIVDESLQGLGIGRYFIEQAMAFIDEKGFDSTYLWTFKGLDSARHLYENAGFKVVEEFEGTQWGKPIIEQKFIRQSPVKL